MRDHLLDLISHIHALGGIDQLRISGTDTETNFNAIADDRSVVIDGMFINPVADFMGLPN